MNDTKQPDPLQLAQLLESFQEAAASAEQRAAAELQPPALDQPQSNPTAQDISDSALLGNIESPFNACMHQEHCKRWKERSGAVVEQKLRPGMVYALPPGDYVGVILRGRYYPLTTPQPPVAEQPQGAQEPVAWALYCADKLCFVGLNRHPLDGYHTDWSFRPLYTRPQPQREPLTDEQIAEVLIAETNGRSTEIGFKTLRAFARAIERAHGIGGEA